MARKSKRKRITEDSDTDSEKEAIKPKDDDDNHHGWTPKSARNNLSVIKDYAKLLESIEDSLEPKLEGFLTFPASGFPMGPQKVCKLLKSHYGGNPKAVPALPTWLEDKLTLWNLERSQITTHTDASKIRNKRIYTEVDYDTKCGVPAKRPKIVIEDDIEAQLAMMDQDDNETIQDDPKPPSTPAKAVKKDSKKAKKSTVKSESITDDPKEPVKEQPVENESAKPEIANDKPVKAEISNDNSVKDEIKTDNDVKETNDKPVKDEITNDKPIKEQIPNDKPVKEKINNDKQVEDQDANDKPVKQSDKMSLHPNVKVT